jgi:spore germination protein KA/spore germination protein
MQGLDVQSAVNDILNKNNSIRSRNISTRAGNITILFVPQLTDRGSLSDFVIRPLMHRIARTIEPITAESLTTSILQMDEMEVKNDPDKIEGEVLNGHAVIALPNSQKYVVLNTKQVQARGVENPQISYALRGPKDSFSENMDVNLSLIRYRIKDNRLKTKPFKVGKRTQTNVLMFYLEDVANDDCVAEVSKRLEEIDIDSILDSGELQQFLTKGHWSLFPQMGVIERSDMACGAIMEGKIVIIMEGSGLALVAPKTFSEYLTSGDDLYDNKFVGAYSKLLRYIAVFVMLVSVPLYVAVVSFNPEVLSPLYTTTLALLRANVPFNALTEALIMILLIEVFRESALRVPREVGLAIGLAGGVIIGQAVVAAGILSTLVLIIATLSLLASYIAPDYTLTNPMRILQVFLVILAGILGLPGLAMGLFVVVAKMISSESFGVPFMAPHAPFGRRDAEKSFYYSKTDFVERPDFLKLKQKRRGRKMP